MKDEEEQFDIDEVIPDLDALPTKEELAEELAKLLTKQLDVRLQHKTPSGDNAFDDLTEEQWDQTMDEY